MPRGSNVSYPKDDLSLQPTSRCAGEEEATSIVSGLMGDKPAPCLRQSALLAVLEIVSSDFCACMVASSFILALPDPLSAPSHFGSRMNANIGATEAAS